MKKENSTLTIIFRITNSKGHNTDMILKSPFKYISIQNESPEGIVSNPISLSLDEFMIKFNEMKL